MTSTAYIPLNRVSKVAPGLKGLSEKLGGRLSHAGVMESTGRGTHQCWEAAIPEFDPPAYEFKDLTLYTKSLWSSSNPWYQCSLASKQLTDILASHVKLLVSEVQGDEYGSPTKWFQNSFHLSCSNWGDAFLGPWVEKVEALRELVDGWNGYNAPSPSKSSIDRAKRFTVTILMGGSSPTRIAPSAVGGVAITSRHGTKKVVAEFFNNGLNSALFADDSDKSMHARRFESTYHDYLKLAREINSYVGG